MLEILRESRCSWIQIGLESGNDLVLESIGKNQKYEQIEKVVKDAYLLNFKIKASVILGHHFDTHDTITETISKSERLKAEYGVEIAWGVNTPFPGTDLYELHDKYKIKILINNWDNFRMDNPIINTKFLNINDLRKYLTQLGK